MTINSTIERSLSNKNKKPPKWCQNPVFSRTNSQSRMVNSQSASESEEEDGDVHSLTSAKISRVSSSIAGVEEECEGSEDSEEDYLDDVRVSISVYTYWLV